LLWRAVHTSYILRGVNVSADATANWLAIDLYSPGGLWKKED